MIHHFAPLLASLLLPKDLHHFLYQLFLIFCLLHNHLYIYIWILLLLIICAVIFTIVLVLSTPVILVVASPSLYLYVSSQYILVPLNLHHVFLIDCVYEIVYTFVIIIGVVTWCRANLTSKEVCFDRCQI